jgi:hypothetical protein
MHLSPSFYLLALFLLVVVDLGWLLLCVFLFSPSAFKRFLQPLLLRTLVCVCVCVGLFVFLKVLAATTSQEFVFDEGSRSCYFSGYVCVCF